MAYNDPDDPGNGPEYHTGLTCRGGIVTRTHVCDKPAGTAWGTLWCFDCNVVRIDRIDRNLKDIQAQLRS